MTGPGIDRRKLLAALGAGGALALAGGRGMAMRAAVELADPPRWPATDAFLHAYIAGKPLPGAVGAIGRAGEPPRFLSHGTGAFQGGVPVDADSLWRIYSMTKPITGMAAMLLVEDGELALDRNIADFLPEWSQPTVLTDPENTLDAEPASGPITVRHLLTHTAGLGYSIITTGPLLEAYNRLGLTPALFRAPIEPNQPQSLAEFSERAASLPLIADPGSLWSYSMSLDLLGRVIEVASGMPFDSFLRQRIFGPLGMDSTFFQVPRSEARRMTANYMFEESEGEADENRDILLADPAAESVYFEELPYPFGGAGLVSSARDYDRFLAMLLGEGEVDGTRIMATETARLAMSDLLPEGVDLSRMFAPMGFGAGGRVMAQPGPTGEGAGSYGWGGAAGTVAWVDRSNGLRASGYIQLFGDQQFGQAFNRAVYADLAAKRADAA